VLKEALRHREDLKVIVMSATLDTAHFAQFFDVLPKAVLTIAGRQVRSCLELYAHWFTYLRRTASSRTPQHRFVQYSVDTLYLETAEPDYVMQPTLQLYNSTWRCLWSRAIFLCF
jgi:hypothetical protein